MTHEEAVAQVDERRRAETRAKLCKSRVSREPIPGKPDAFAVRVDGREVGLLRKFDGGSWSAFYMVDGANRRVADDMPQRSALQRLKAEVMQEDERRVAAELVLADAIARDLWPRGMVVGVLLQIRANMLAGGVSPAVATMNAVHVLAHTTGVNASR